VVGVVWVGLSGAGAVGAVGVGGGRGDHGTHGASQEDREAGTQTEVCHTLGYRALGPSSEGPASRFGREVPPSAAAQPYAWRVGDRP
jgi:hypothetical protein